MHLSQFGAMFSIMLLAALIPSVSNLAIVSRSAALGLSHGLVTCLGIAVVDVTFILIAVLGLNLLSQLLDQSFIYIKIIGGLYLIWLAMSFWRAEPDKMRLDASGTNYTASFLTGFFITLADQKAILFYLGLFPAFIDLSKLSILDTMIIIWLALIAIAAKLIYGVLAQRAKLIFQRPQSIRSIYSLAGIIIFLLGGYLLISIFL